MNIIVEVGIARLAQSINQCSLLYTWHSPYSDEEKDWMIPTLYPGKSKRMFLFSSKTSKTALELFQPAIYLFIYAMDTEVLSRG